MGSDETYPGRSSNGLWSRVRGLASPVVNVSHPPSNIVEMLPPMMTIDADGRIALTSNVVFTLDQRPIAVLPPGAGVPITSTHLSPAALAIHLELAVGIARRADLNRIADELQELALEACPADQRPALAARFGILVSEGA